MGFRFLKYCFVLLLTANCQRSPINIPEPLGPIINDIKLQTTINIDSLSMEEREIHAWQETGLNKEVLKRDLLNPETCVLSFRKFYGCFKSMQYLSKMENGSLILDVSGIENTDGIGTLKEELGLFSLYMIPKENIDQINNFLSEILDSQKLDGPTHRDMSTSHRIQARRIKAEMERIQKLYATEFRVFQKEAQKISEEKYEILRHRDDMTHEFHRRWQKISHDKEAAADLEKRFEIYDRQEVQPLINQELTELRKKKITPLANKIYNKGTRSYFRLIDQYYSYYGPEEVGIATSLILKKFLTYSSDGHSSIRLSYQLKEKYKMNPHSNHSYFGIGLELMPAKYDDQQQVFIRPIEGYPGHKAGLKANDSILEVVSQIQKKKVKLVVSELMKTMSPMDVARKIAGHLNGPKGTAVTLKIRPWNQNKDVVKTLTIQRGTQSLPSSYKTMTWLKKKIGILKIKEFSNNRKDTTTFPLCDKVAKQIVENNSKVDGWLLDLRNNPGGLLHEVACISDLFLKKDQNIAYLGMTPPLENEQWNYISLKNPLTNKKLIVIINENSASGSETVSGALQDNKRAVIIGRRSLGKGSVQENGLYKHPSIKGWNYFWMDYYVTFKETISYFFLPSGRSPERVGITPDINVGHKPHKKEVFALRKEHQYPLSLKAMGQPWTQSRPQYISNLKNCADRGRAVTHWYNQLTPFKSSFQIFYALDTLHCMINNP